MPIYVPNDTGGVSLGRGSAAPVVDTYVRPAVPHEDAGLSQLANSLSKLGVNFGNMGAEQADAAEKEDLRNVEYYKTMVGELKEGVPYLTQIGERLPEQSAVVRARVAEAIGSDRALTEARAQYEELLQNNELRLNPEAFNAELDRLKAQAFEKVKGQPAFGSGYVKQYESFMDKVRGQATEERSAYYNRIQAEALVNKNREEQAALRERVPVKWRTADINQLPALRSAVANTEDHVRFLNGDFATRLDRMISEMPPQLREQAKISSGYRSVERQAEIYKTARPGYAAKPGRSNHNHGQAVDWSGGANFHNTPAGKWIHENAEKFGLYFPLWGENYKGRVRESWHMEMIGGRRQNGDGPSQVAKLDDTDGEDSYDAVTAVADKIIGRESSGDPTAQNGATSAGGLGQFVDKTWLATVRKHSPENAGKSDAQLLAMKTDPQYASLQRDMTIAHTKDNANRLKDAGLPVTEGNIYLMHFAGSGDGPKIIKASDGTPVKQVMQAESIEKNPQIANMTVGEMKEWATLQAGGTTSPTRAKQNITRSIDREYRQSSSLTDLYRRDVLSKDILERAKSAADASILEEMPPELMTPMLGAQFAEMRRHIIAVQNAEVDRQRAEERYQEEQENKDAIARVNKTLAEGGKPDLNDPVIQRNPELFKYVVANQRNELLIDPVSSQVEALKYGEQVEAAEASGNWSSIMGPEWQADKRPSMSELYYKIFQNTNMKSEDKEKLMAGLRDKINASAVAGGPEAQSYFNDRMSEKLRNAHAGVGIKLDIRMGNSPNFTAASKKVFETVLRAESKAYTEDNPGQVIKGSAKTAAYEKALKAAMEEVDRLGEGSKLGGEGGEGGKGGGEGGDKLKTQPAKPKTEWVEVDGKNYLKGQEPKVETKTETKTETPNAPVDPLDELINPKAVPSQDGAKTLMDEQKSATLDKYKKAGGTKLKEGQNFGEWLYSIAEPAMKTLDPRFRQSEGQKAMMHSALMEDAQFKALVKKRNAEKDKTKLGYIDSDIEAYTTDFIAKSMKEWQASGL